MGGDGRGLVGDLFGQIVEIVRQRRGISGEIGRTVRQRGRIHGVEGGFARNRLASSRSRSRQRRMDDLAVAGHQRALDDIVRDVDLQALRLLVDDEA